MSLWSLVRCFLCFGVLGLSILSVSREKPQKQSGEEAKSGLQITKEKEV